jgi:predicted nucleic acid-binding protein
MIRASLDSNILIYAALEPQTNKGQRANDVILRASARGIVAAQALLEFVAVVRRREPALTHQAIVQAEAWASVFETAPTTNLVIRDALALVRNHRFQVWDAVICAAVSAAGADIFFSEDLQDGLALGSMRAVNPFARTDDEIRKLLAP